jgi:hypothetical protein
MGGQGSGRKPEGKGKGGKSLYGKKQMNSIMSYKAKLKKQGSAPIKMKHTLGKLIGANIFKRIE